MSDKPQHRNPKPRRQKVHAPVLSPEDQAKALLAKQQAEAEAKAERERVELYGKSVQTMSHSQLRSELVKTIKREHAGRPPEPQAGLTILYATVLLNVLDNTKTTPVFEANSDGVPKRVARLDQINKLGTLQAYAR